MQSDFSNYDTLWDKIVNKVKTYSWIFLLLLLILSVLGNIYFIMGKGINVVTNNISTSTSSSYSNASSSSIGVNINGGNYWGNSKVSYQTKDFDSLKELVIFVNGLNEGNLYNYRIVVNPNNVYSLVYRETNDMKAIDSTTTKVVNGVEQK